ncbi:MAG: response regulator [Planctomycetia bacterium]|nr:response regulator [Planctomycetia bacterium]
MNRDEPLRVLHIDDDPATTRLVAKMLGSHGIEVTQLNDPRQAIDTVLNGNYRVVVLDIDMPGLDGIELLQQIKQADGGTAVIMLTGLVSLSSALRTMRRGAHACLFKPLVDADALLECIREVTHNIHRWWDTLKQLSDLRRQEHVSLIEEDRASLLTTAKR